MSALTVRMADDKYLRLKALSRRRRTSVNQLFDEMATLLLAESDAQTHFQLRALRGTGQQKHGLELLDKARSWFAPPDFARARRLDSTGQRQLTTAHREERRMNGRVDGFVARTCGVTAPRACG